MIAKEMNDFTETAGHQRLAHTVNVTLMEKFDVPRRSVPSWLHAPRDKNDVLNQPPMDVAMLLSAETLIAMDTNVNSQYQLVNTMKIASPNKSQNAAAHMLASVTPTSVAILEKLNVQKDMNQPSSLHTNVAQLPSVSNHQRPPPQPSTQPHHTQLHQQLLHTFSQQPQSVSITKELHDAMVRSGKSAIANHAAALPQVLLNALSNHVRLQYAKKELIKSEPTTLMLVVLLHAVLLAHQKSVQNANKPKLQHANVMKILSVKQSMLTAVATSTTANATRTSVSIFLKKLAQLATLELLSIAAHAAQLLNVVTPKPQQLQQPLLSQPQPLLQLLIRHPHIS